MDVRMLSALAAPTKASSRTAKSCGPDPPMLQGYRIWLIACKRNASSQPARLILRRIEA
jgi:hypothetical protein